MNQHKNSSQENKPIIGISLGDYNGVGPEVILKTLSNQLILKICTPVIYGSMKVLSRYRKILKIKDWYINQANSIQQITFKKANVININTDKKLDVSPGKPSPESSHFAFESLQAATQDLKMGLIDGLVTAPISKIGMQGQGFEFPGHTEYLTQTLEAQDSLMLMVCEDMRVGVVTGHVPLKEVSSLLTRERIFTKAKILLKSLQEDFGVQRPKVAVLGFNPHAGEDGLLGDEEQQIIQPSIVEMKKRGALIYGPYPADGFFGTGEYRKFDATLAIYHDQGLIPFKTLAFERGVNYTAGLSAVRTSPDHGTAFDIAGKNLADETSFREAVFLACDIVKTRQELAVEAPEEKAKAVEKP